MYAVLVFVPTSGAAPNRRGMQERVAPPIDALKEVSITKCLSHLCTPLGQIVVFLSSALPGRPTGARRGCNSVKRAGMANKQQVQKSRQHLQSQSSYYTMQICYSLVWKTHVNMPPHAGQWRKERVHDTAIIMTPIHCKPSWVVILQIVLVEERTRFVMMLHSSRMRRAFH